MQDIDFVYNMKEILEQIRSSYDRCLIDDDGNSRSRHWEKRLSESSPEGWITESKLSKFRSKHSQLSKGMDHAGTFRETIEAYRELHRRLGERTVRYLSEIDVGCPEVWEISNGFRTNCSDIDLSYFCFQANRLANCTPEIICEIGGGYGGLAHKLKVTNPNSSIIIIDLPEANILQTYYLNALHPKNVSLLYSDYVDQENRPQLTKELIRRYDFIILPPWCANDIENEVVDLFINTRSMMEMTSETIDYYFDIISRSIRLDGLFYCVNRYEKSTVGYPVRISEYPFDDYWKVIFSEPFWRKPHIHELMVSRKKHIQPSIGECLKKLPKETPSVSYHKKRLSQFLQFLRSFFSRPNRRH